MPPEADFGQFREGFATWTRRHGRSCKELIFTIMARDWQQEHVLAFFKSVLNNSQVSDTLAKVQVRLQFPSMSQSIADETSMRILRKEL
jgi:hypothetical protein